LTYALQPSYLQAILWPSTYYSSYNLSKWSLNLPFNNGRYTEDERKIYGIYTGNSLQMAGGRLYQTKA